MLDCRASFKQCCLFCDLCVADRELRTNWFGSMLVDHYHSKLLSVVVKRCEDVTLTTNRSN